MTEEQEKFIKEHITPVFQKYGVEVVEVPEKFYNFITVKFKEAVIEIHAAWLNVEVMEFVFKEWDNLVTIANSITNSNPFHSDIRRAVHNEYPRTMASKVSAAYTLVCKFVRDSGKRIWS